MLTYGDWAYGWIMTMPTYSIKNEYIEGIWWLIKKAHEKKRLL